MADLTDFSRFAKTEPFVFDGKETYGTWVQFSFLTTRPSDDQIKVFKVTSAVEGRPDLIANQLYGTPSLDWVLIAFNNARQALNWPMAGSIIEYPVESIVLPQLL